MNDIKRIEREILKQVFFRFKEFSQIYYGLDDRHFSLDDFGIALSPSDYSILNEALYGR